MTPRLRRLAAPAAVALALAGCSSQPSSTDTPVPVPSSPKAAFPSIPDSAFYPIRCSGPDAGDVALDPVTGNVDRDMIGDATYPAFYRYADATDVYFRMRLDGKPTKNNGALIPSSYDVLIDTDGNLNTYEYMLTADGNISGGKVLWVRNSVQEPANPRDAAYDVPSDLLADLSPPEDYWDAKVATDGSNFNGTPDWFFTLRIPKTLLAAAGLDLTRSFVVWGGTNGQNYSLNADFGCFANLPTTLSQAASAPINLDPAGAPDAIADAATTPEDTAVLVDVLANDTGLRDTPITVAIATPPVHGGAVVNVGNTVSYTPAVNWNGTDSFRYTVSDLQGQSSTGTVTVTVTAMNDPPVAVADSASVAEDGSMIVSVLANDSDVDGDTLSISAVTQSPHGTVTFSGGTATYVPAANWNGTDSFTYTASDGHGGTSTATVTVIVSAVNDAPVASADSASVAEDGSVNVSVLANDSDVEGDTLAISAVTQGAHGTVTSSGGTVTYVPVANWNGTDSFTYTASDGHGGSATAIVTITVTPVNDAPVAVADSASVAEDGSVDVSVLANDSDVDGDALSISSVTQGAHGTVTSSSGAVAYVPAANWSGTDFFTYIASDGHGGTSTATVAVVVAAVNDAPVAAADSASVVEDGSVDVSVLANDSDVEGDALVVSAVTQGAHGAVTFSGGTATYTPAADWNGADSFTYTASDGHGGSATATVTVTVTPVNDPPVAVADSASVAEDGSAEVSVLANDSDVEGNTLSISSVTQGAHGTVSFSGATATYTPVTGWTGTDSFTYTASDGHGGTATATVTVAVNAVNGPPVASADAFTTGEDVAVTVDVLANDIDPDGDALSVTAVTQGSHGAVTFSSGSATYTPAADWNGVDSFTYSASDGRGGTGTTTVTMIVTAVNDAPVAAADSATVAEDGSVNVNVLANDSDVDGDALSISAVTQSPHGTVTFSSGAVTYVPAANWNGTDSFTYTASDGHGGTSTATVTVVVAARNDVPVASPDSASVAEDGSVNVSVLANDSDVDGDALSLFAVTQGAHGTVTYSGGTATYTPAANWNGTDSFTYTASDDHGGTATATVTVTVTAVNDAPVAAADSASVAEGGSVDVSVLANDSDVDGDALVVSAVTQGGHGTVTFSGGTAHYAPAVNWNGTDSFTYTASDGHGGAATATVTVTVTPVNDPPVVTDDSATVAEDGSVDANVLANDSDPEGDPLSLAAVTQGSHGSVTSAGGTATYTPAADWNGTDSFTYTVSDGHGGTATATVTVTVTPVNDAPVAAADSATVAEDGSVDVSVLANDTDADGDALSISAVTPGAHGTVTYSGGTATYTPAADWNGTDSFTYTASDGHGGTATATVTVTVTAVDDPPIAADDSATVAEDAATGVNVVVLANDRFPDGAALSAPVVVSTAPMHGVASVEADGSITYHPAADYSGADSLAYRIEDADGDVATATVSITVTPVNDPPVAVDDAATALAGGGLITVDVLANDSDVDGDAPFLSSVTQGAHGAVAIAGGAVTYSPASGFTGTDSFTYSIDDGHGETATASVTVGISLDPAGTPAAAHDAATTLEDTAVEIDVLANDAGLRDAPIAVTIRSPPAAGVATVSATGTILFTPAADTNGSFTFSYAVTDAEGESAIATVTVAVTPVNDPPAATPDAATVVADVPTDIDVLANDSDAESDPLSVAEVTQGANGSVAIVDGRVRYTPVAGFTGTDTFTYTVSDGNGGTTTARVTVTVATHSDPGADDTLSVAGGGCSSSGGGSILGLVGLLLLALRGRRIGPPARRRGSRRPDEPAR